MFFFLVNIPVYLGMFSTMEFYQNNVQLIRGKVLSALGFIGHSFRHRQSLWTYIIGLIYPITNHANDNNNCLLEEKSLKWSLNL